MTFIGNVYYYQLLLDWLKKPLTTKTLNKDCICFVIGKHGIGKTYGINQAIKDLNYSQSNFEGNSYKDFIDFITKRTTSDIVSQFQGNLLSNKIILIDEFESLILYDRTFLNNLTELIDNKNKNELPAVKIVIATIPLETKNALKLCDNSYKIHLSVPSETDIFLFLKNTYSKIKNDKLLYISENCENNISIALTLVQDQIKTIKNNYDKSITLNNIYNNNSIDVLRNILDQDRSLYPLKFHENSIKAIQQRKGTKVKKVEMYKDILHSLCLWDVMNTNSKKHCIDTDIHFEYITRNINTLYSLPMKKNNIELSTEFTKLFNYLSLKKKSIITLYNSDIPWYTMGVMHKIRVDNITKKFSV